MTTPILNNTAKADLYNATVDAEEAYLAAVRENRLHGDRPTITEVYLKGIYCALYSLVCRFGLEEYYLDWLSEPAVETGDEKEEEET